MKQKFLPLEINVERSYNSKEWKNFVVLCFTLITFYLNWKAWTQIWETFYFTKKEKFSLGLFWWRNCTLKAFKSRVGNFINIKKYIYEFMKYFTQWKNLLWWVLEHTQMLLSAYIICPPAIFFLQFFIFCKRSDRKRMKRKKV